MAEFNPDEFLASNGPAQAAPVGNLQTQAFDPDQFLNQKTFEDQQLQQSRYGTLSQQAAAGLEGAARGASLGASDWAEAGLGISTPEDIKQRMAANPWTSGIGNMVGGAGLLIGTGGLAAPAEGVLLAGGMKPLAARALAYGAEGAMFGAGKVNSDLALGDPELNASKIATEIGIGALLGGGLGVLSKGIEASPALYRKVFSKADIAPSITEGIEGSIPEAGIGAETPGTEPGVVDYTPKGKPMTMAEIQKRVAESKFAGETTELPQKAIVQDAASRLELETPVHELQLESLNGQSPRDLYKTALEMPGKEGDALRSYEALQKNELNYHTDKTIEAMSPGVKPTSDAVEGGKRAIDTFTKQYTEEKGLLAPAFEELKKLETPDPFNHVPGVIAKFEEAVPGISRMFDATGEELKINPYSSAWGIDRATYNAAKEAVEALKEPAFIKELVNIRKGLDQNVDILAKGDAPREIMAMKARMMDYIQEQVAKSSGSDVNNVRELFKKYAINEQQRGVIEKSFGASVGSPEFGQISKIKPENISDNIFRNTATVDAAKNILPPEEFKKMLANWLSEQKALVTDKGVFSSQKFATFLKRNQDALKVAFDDNPEALQRLHDLTNVSRILPDSVSINPSGTAKTLLGILKAHSIGDLLGNIKAYGKEKFDQQMIAQKVDQVLQGKAEAATKLDALKTITDKIGTKIQSGAKAIFNNSGLRGAVESGGSSLSDKLYDSHVKRIRELSGDPSAMMNHLGSSTEGLYAAAPNVTQSLNNKIIAGAQFLNSKIPKTSSDLLLSHEFEPSPDQKAKFNRYFHAVNDPISALKDIKSGKLTNETMETLMAVHPELLDDMRKSVLHNLDPKKAKELDYPIKISLAKFLGQPLDTNMMPQVRAMYQAALQGPSLSNQQGQRQKQGHTAAFEKMKLANRTGSVFRKTGEDG